MLIFLIDDLLKDIGEMDVKIEEEMNKSFGSPPYFLISPHDYRFSPSTRVEDIIKKIRKSCEESSDIIRIFTIHPYHLVGIEKGNQMKFVNQIHEIMKDNFCGIPACILCFDICWEAAPEVNQAPTEVGVCLQHGEKRCICGGLWFKYFKNHVDWLKNKVCVISSNPKGMSKIREGDYSPAFDKKFETNDPLFGKKRFIQWIFEKYHEFQNAINGFVSPWDFAKESALLFNKTGMQNITHYFGNIEYQYDRYRNHFFTETEYTVSYCQKIVGNAFNHLNAFIKLGESFNIENNLPFYWGGMKELKTNMDSFINSNHFTSGNPRAPYNAFIKKFNESVNIDLSKLNDSECDDCADLKSLCIHGLENKPPKKEVRRINLAFGPNSKYELRGTGDIRNLLFRVYLNHPVLKEITLVNFIKNICNKHNKKAKFLIKKKETNALETNTMPLETEASEVFLPRKEFFELFKSFAAEISECSPIEIEIRSTDKNYKIDGNPYLRYFFCIKWGKNSLPRKKPFPFGVGSIKPFVRECWINNFYQLWLVRYENERKGTYIWDAKKWDLGENKYDEDGELIQKSDKPITCWGQFFPLDDIHEKKFYNALIFGITTCDKK